MAKKDSSVAQNVTDGNEPVTGFDLETRKRIPLKPDGTIETTPGKGYFWDRGVRRPRSFVPCWEAIQKPPKEYSVYQHPAAS